MKTLRAIPTLALSVAASVAACGGSQQGTPVAGTPATQTMLTSQNAADKRVVDRLAKARCDQEAKCQNIAPGAKFNSREICMNQMRGSIGNELNAYNCPRGIDSDAVDRCMSAIEEESCEHPFDTLSRVDKCRTGNLCIR